MKQDHRPGRPLGRDDAAAPDQLAYAVVIYRPQRIAGGREVVLGVDHPQLMAARDEHQRSVELIDLVKKDGDIHRARLGHLVVVLPGAVILVPLPDITVEGHLAVDLELVHVKLFAQNLPHRIDHARMAAQSGKGRAVHVRGKVGAHGIAAFFTYVLRTLLAVEQGHLIDERLHLIGIEQRRKEQVTVALEILELLLVQLHTSSSLWHPSRRALPWIPVTAKCLVAHAFMTIQFFEFELEPINL